MHEFAEGRGRLDSTQRRKDAKTQRDGGRVFFRRPGLFADSSVLVLAFKFLCAFGAFASLRYRPICSRSKVEAMDRSADGQRDFDAFVMSAKGETSTKSFQEWAGGEQVTLAIVFTDVVGSTALGEAIRDEAMNEVRRAHFAQSRRLIGQFQGREIKTIGDSFMAAFKCADAALDYAWALQANTGHPQLQVRAGIHIGPMHNAPGHCASRARYKSAPASTSGRCAWRKGMCSAAR